MRIMDIPRRCSTYNKNGNNMTAFFWVVAVIAIGIAIYGIVREVQTRKEIKRRIEAREAAETLAAEQKIAEATAARRAAVIQARAEEAEARAAVLKKHDKEKAEELAKNALAAPKVTAGAGIKSVPASRPAIRKPQPSSTPTVSNTAQPDVAGLVIAAALASNYNNVEADTKSHSTADYDNSSHTSSYSAPSSSYDSSPSHSSSYSSSSYDSGSSSSSYSSSDSGGGSF